MDILGKIFLSGNKEINNVDFKQVELVGLYFSASWCWSCVHLTAKLMELYRLINEKNKKMEIILVPREETEDQFFNYYKKMPWLSVPFSDISRIRRLISTFGITRLPSLVILDKNGNFLTKDGVDNIEDYGIYSYDAWIYLRDNKKK